MSRRLTGTADCAALAERAVRRRQPNGAEGKACQRSERCGEKRGPAHHRHPRVSRPVSEADRAQTGLASESTIERLLRANGQKTHRGRKRKSRTRSLAKRWPQVAAKCGPRASTDLGRDLRRLIQRNSPAQRHPLRQRHRSAITVKLRRSWRSGAAPTRRPGSGNQSAGEGTRAGGQRRARSS